MKFFDKMYTEALPVLVIKVTATGIAPADCATTTATQQKAYDLHTCKLRFTNKKPSVGAL